MRNASGVDEYQPSISPDGSKICFTLQTTIGNSSTAEIYTASLPSFTGLTDISNDNTKGDINCTWSPDGQFIAYVNGTFTSGALVMKRADGTSTFPIPLEDVAGHFDGNPDWAPDGSPDCPDSTVITAPNKPITIPLECTDTGPQYERTDPNGFVANDGGPLHGTTSDDAPLANPSTVKYTPDQGFEGRDRIIFGSFDDFGFGTDRGTVRIEVRSCFGKTATVVGTSGRDNLRGTRGRDVIVSLGGNDTIKSFGGKDVVCAGAGKDVIKTGRGADRAAGGAGADRMIGAAGKDLLRGGAGRDRMFGGAGRDRMFGGAGRDRLFGNRGADVLNGGPKRDHCAGGPGRDRLKRCEG